MHGRESRTKNVVGLTATFSPCPQLVHSFCVNFVSDSGDSYRFRDGMEEVIGSIPIRSTK